MRIEEKNHKKGLLRHYKEIQAVDQFNEFYLRVKKSEEISKKINEITDEIEQIAHRIEIMEEVGLFTSQKPKIKDEKNYDFLIENFSKGKENNFSDLIKKIKEFNQNKIRERIKNSFSELEKAAKLRPYFMDLGLGDKTFEKPETSKKINIIRNRKSRRKTRFFE